MLYTAKMAREENAEFINRKNEEARETAKKLIAEIEVGIKDNASRGNNSFTYTTHNVTSLVMDYTVAELKDNGYTVSLQRWNTIKIEW